MLAIERQSKIREIIEEQKTIKVSNLSQKFQVTEETIRRDLEKLSKAYPIKKTYGGAILVQEEQNENEDLGVHLRINENIERKQKIGLAISEMLTEGMTVMLDSSTTCLEVAKKLNPHRKLTVITNSVNNIVELSKNEEVTVVSTGGRLRNKSLSLIGPTAKKNVESYYADKAIISCKGIDIGRGVMESNELEVEIKQAFMLNANEVILALDSTKVNRSSIYRLGQLGQVDTIVTDKEMSAKWQEICDEYDIKVVVAK